MLVIKLFIFVLVFLQTIETIYCKMDQRLQVVENQGEEDANMVTAVEDTRLLDRDVTMVRETETPRPATAPTGIARPTVRESPSLSEQHLQH